MVGVTCHRRPFDGRARPRRVADGATPYGREGPGGDRVGSAAEVLRPVDAVGTAGGDADADGGVAAVEDVGAVARALHPRGHDGARRAVARGDVLAEPPAGVALGADPGDER